MSLIGGDGNEDWECWLKVVPMPTSPSPEPTEAPSRTEPLSPEPTKAPVLREGELSNTPSQTLSNTPEPRFSNTPSPTPSPTPSLTLSPTSSQTHPPTSPEISN